MQPLRPLRLAAVAAFLALAACAGGGERTVSNSPDTGNSSINRVPTIGGQPSPAAVVGQAYRFQPAASDPDGEPLTFSITNKPVWATFDTATGALTGTPGASDVRTFANIVISATDASGASASLVAFSIAVTATASTAGTARVAWVPPTQAVDSTALKDLAGFYIYYGQSEANLTQSVQVASPSATSYQVDGLTPGTWYFEVTAITSSGAESARSSRVSKTIG